MKNFKKIFLIILVALLMSPFQTHVQAEESNTIDVHFFHQFGCLGCEEMTNYFNEEILPEYDNINIIRYDIGEQDNYNLMIEVANTLGIPAGLTPTIVIGGVGFMGETDKIKAEIRGLLDYYSNNDYVDVTEKLINDETILDGDIDDITEIVDIPNTIYLPIIGEVETDTLSTLVFAILIGFTDGLNPCAMWILVFLLSMLITMKDKKRMWIIGFTFLLTSAILYGLVMVLISEGLSLFNQFGVFRYIVASFSIAMGLYLLIQYFRKRKEDDGCVVVDDNKRKSIIKRIQEIVKSDKLIIAILGTILLAISVNLVELACTAALPAGFVSMLSVQNYTFLQRLMYIGVYVLFFLIDDLIIFGIALATMKIKGISNKLSKVSNIVGGVLMIIIGILLIFSLI